MLCLCGVLSLKANFKSIEQDGIFTRPSLGVGSAVESEESSYVFIDLFFVFLKEGVFLDLLAIKFQ